MKKTVSKKLKSSSRGDFRGKPKSENKEDNNYNKPNSNNHKGCDYCAVGVTFIGAVGSHLSGGDFECLTVAIQTGTPRGKRDATSRK